MLALIRTTLGGGGDTKRLLALAALIALLPAALLPLAPAAADEHLANLNRFPDNLELLLEITEDSDNIVQPGDELTVTASLRFSAHRFEEPYDPYRRWVIPAASVGPSFLYLAGPLDWESGVSRKLTIAEQNLVGFESLPVPNGNLRAFDERTIVVRGHVGGVATLYIIDAWSKQLAATITRPDDAENSYFGFGGVTLDEGKFSDSVAVWHETDSTAWMFVSSPRQNNNVGRVYIYRLEWDEFSASVEATLETTLTPPLSEASNRHGGVTAYYSTSLAVSRDGSTLAVASSYMNAMGAVYVYTRPDGPGRNWGDIRYEDGVKVTPVAIPSHGSSSANAPFTPSSTGRTSHHTDCDAYCSRAYSMFEQFTELGIRYIGLSADGRVLAVPVSEKRFSFETPGGSFNNAYRREDKGEAYVFVAPEGGWNAAPRADRDADGNSKTLIAAQADARSFDPETHYSPGPLRRITEPDAILVSRLWTEAGRNGGWFGEGLAISPDGTTVIADADTGGAGGSGFVFQQSSPEAWRALDGGYILHTATFTGALGDFPSYGNMAFSGDSGELSINNGNSGQLTVFRRPADGIWKDADGGDDDAEQRSGIHYVLKDAHNGAQVVFGHDATITTSDAGCTIEVLDEISTTTCPITLPSSTVVVPEGTAHGVVTLSGQVTLQMQEVPTSTLTLRNALELRIGEVREVAEVKLDLAVDKKRTTSTSDDTPYPSALRRQGDSTRLRLQILNESGTASHAGSIAAVQLTSTAGALAVVDATLEGDSCVGISCALNTANINANNADRLLVTLSHEGKAAAAEVRATVFSTTGDTFETPPVRIALAGSAERIAVAAPATGVTNVDAADLDADGLTSDGADTRDELLLAVTAADGAGNDVALPSGARRTRLLDPDGQPVAAESVRVTWPHRANPTRPFTPTGGDNPPILNSKRQLQVKIDVNRPASTPLASGEYTLELWAGQQKTTQKFSVSGGAAEISLSDPGAVRVGETFSVTASFNDAAGVAVPNGTVVDWPEIVSTGGGGQRVVQTSKQTRTTDGQATASFQAVSPGSVAVTAGADCAQQLTSVGTTLTQCVVRGVRLVQIQPAAAAQTSPAEDLSTTEPGGLASYLGETPANAAELLEGLPEINTLLLWLNGEWIRYGQTDGQEIPGSINFRIKTGSILWLSQ